MTDKDIAIRATKHAMDYVAVAATEVDKYSDAGKALKRAEHALSSAMDALNLTPYEKLRDAVGHYLGEYGYCERLDDGDSDGWCNDHGCEYCNMGRSLAALDHEDPTP